MIIIIIFLIWKKVGEAEEMAQKIFQITSTSYACIFTKYLPLSYFNMKAYVTASVYMVMCMYYITEILPIFFSPEVFFSTMLKRK